MQVSWEVKQPFGRVFKFLITVFLLVAISLTIITIWTNWALLPASSVKKEKIFVIAKGEDLGSIAKRLKREGLIKDPFIFRVYLKITGLDEKIQAGSYKLSPHVQPEKTASTLTKGRLDKWVTFVEGLRKEEVAQILNKEFGIDKQEFISKSSEGELFPDTYLIPVDAKINDVLNILEKNFNKKFSSTLRKQATEKGLTKEQALTLASIVEREAKTPEERPIIAGILIKRWKEGMRLAADATVQYALGYSEKENRWWRKTLTNEDLDIDSPYNTRKNAGLPPGPICNPGLASIEAVINPKETPYYFYIHDKKGGVHYATTFEEHQENINKYLR